MDIGQFISFLIIPEILLIFAFMNILSISYFVVINSPFACLDVDIRVGSVILGTRYDDCRHSLKLFVQDIFFSKSVLKSPSKIA